MKWIAENFLAAWALHDVCVSAEAGCLLRAAWAGMANDKASAAATVVNRIFFMGHLRSFPAKKRQRAPVRSDFFPDDLFRKLRIDSLPRLRRSLEDRRQPRHLAVHQRG